MSNRGMDNKFNTMKYRVTSLSIIPTGIFREDNKFNTMKYRLTSLNIILATFGVLPMVKSANLPIVLLVPFFTMVTRKP